MTIAAIHQPQYLPYLGFFHKIAQADIFVVLDNVQFHRRGLQHRNKIKTSQGWQWLTVPVTSGSRDMLGDVGVSQGEPWQAKHARAIELNYARAPFYGTLGDELREIIGRPWDRLVSLDVTLIRWIMGVVGLERPILFASELEVEGASTELLVGLCRAVGAEEYLSGTGGRDYMELDVFKEAGVGVRWQEFTHPAYAQQFPSQGFVPNLSVIDPLLCCGPGEVLRWCDAGASGGR